MRAHARAYTRANAINVLPRINRNCTCNHRRAINNSFTIYLVNTLPRVSTSSEFYIFTANGSEWTTPSSPQCCLALRTYTTNKSLQPKNSGTACDLNHNRGFTYLVFSAFNWGIEQPQTNDDNIVNMIQQAQQNWSLMASYNREKASSNLTPISSEK